MKQDIKGGYVEVETHRSITTIEFFHPQGNSLPSKILEDIAQEIHSAGVHDDCKLIILRSGGDRTFCSGASFNELASIRTEEEGKKFFSGFGNVINEMRRCPKFIIGRIQGKCVGGGVGLAAAVDYAIATEAAEVKLSELAVGIGPFVVGPVIERRMGVSAFTHMAIDATMWRNAEWARRKGLFAEVHPNIEAMDESIGRLSAHLVHSNPDAMHEMKKVFWKGTEHWDALLLERAAISGKLVLSDHTREAINKFKAAL